MGTVSVKAKMEEMKGEPFAQIKNRPQKAKENLILQGQSSVSLKFHFHTLSEELGPGLS